MTNKEFKYWFNGYLTLTSDLNLNGEQINIIRNHANLVKTVEDTLDNDIKLLLEELEKKTLTTHSIKLKEIETLSL